MKKRLLLLCLVFIPNFALANELMICIVKGSNFGDDVGQVKYCKVNEKGEAVPGSLFTHIKNGWKIEAVVSSERNRSGEFENSQVVYLTR